MIAAGAEFATYFTDTDAVTKMMDTLSDYAMGMSGGGALDSTALVDYATGLGKIMTGAYDAMNEKGFEFSDTQKLSSTARPRKPRLCRLWAQNMRMLLPICKRQQLFPK